MTSGQLASQSSTFDRSWNRHLRTYFDTAADSYLTVIAPALAPLATGLIRLAEVKRGERVLDLGSGTGAVTQMALRITEHVTAVDFSHKMLKRSQNIQGAGLAQADMHELCLGSMTLECILASFAFNSSDPVTAFAEAYRVLAPGGRLVLQEWGAVDELSAMFTDTVTNYYVEESPPALAAMREAMSKATPWDDIESVDELVAGLRAAGFTTEPAVVQAERIEFQAVDDFIGYKLAWPSRKAEFDAMGVETRKLCEADLRENLETWKSTGGLLLWNPEVIRIVAHRS